MGRYLILARPASLRAFRRPFAPAFAPDRMLLVSRGALRRRFCPSPATFLRIEVCLKGDPTNLGFSTRAIHAGQKPDPRTGAVAVPIYQTSTYVQEALGEPAEFEYPRVQNPTRQALEEQVSSLERGHSAFAFASGM